MVRVVMAALAAAAIVFFWGFLAWAALMFYSFAFHNMPHEQEVVAALKSNITESGVYWFPGMPEGHPDAQSEGMKAYLERHRSGPLGLVFYRAEGAEAMSAVVLVRGAVLYFLAALVMGTMIRMLRISTFSRRLAFVVFVTLFAMLITYASNWNWFSLPDVYAGAMIIDGLAGWFIAGIAMAAIIKIRPAAM